MSESWRQPRRVLMAALGALTVFYLLAPTLVIVPMSFTEARILSFPPQGFTLQWYERMVTDRQWSTGLVNSLQVAVLTADAGNRARHARRAGVEPRPASTVARWSTPWCCHR